ncbi:MAG TPA: hypothetical protein VMW26_07725 [Methanomassiliicoccales archaeon]|nr:hypothetical protein [Methanomassiliicoccales archaeon]
MAVRNTRLNMTSYLVPENIGFSRFSPIGLEVTLGIENTTLGSSATAACCGSGWGVGAGGGYQIPSLRLPDRS